MNALEKTSLDKSVTINLSVSKEEIASKLIQTTGKIVIDIVRIIESCKSMGLQTLVDTHVTPRQKPLSEMDDRTNKFFQKMMEGVNKVLDELSIPQFLLVLGL